MTTTASAKRPILMCSQSGALLRTPFWKQRNDSSVMALLHRCDVQSSPTLPVGWYRQWPRNVTQRASARATSVHLFCSRQIKSVTEPSCSCYGRAPKNTQQSTTTQGTAQQFTKNSNKQKTRKEEGAGEAEAIEQFTL